MDKRTTLKALGFGALIYVLPDVRLQLAGIAMIIMFLYADVERLFVDLNIRLDALDDGRADRRSTRAVKPS